MTYVHKPFPSLSVHRFRLLLPTQQHQTITSTTMGKLIPNAFNLLVVIAAALGSTGNYAHIQRKHIRVLNRISLQLWDGCDIFDDWTSSILC